MWQSERLILLAFSAQTLAQQASNLLSCRQIAGGLVPAPVLLCQRATTARKERPSPPALAPSPLRSPKLSQSPHVTFFWRSGPATHTGRKPRKDSVVGRTFPTILRVPLYLPLIGKGKIQCAIHTAGLVYGGLYTLLRRRRTASCLKSRLVLNRSQQ